MPDHITEFAQDVLTEARGKLQGPHECVEALCQVLGHLVLFGIKEDGDKQKALSDIADRVKQFSGEEIKRDA